jgi:hypothetical protein
MRRQKRGSHMGPLFVSLKSARRSATIGQQQQLIHNEKQQVIRVILNMPMPQSNPF